MTINKPDSFIVDFSVVVKWLRTRKDNLKRLLVAKFKENKDFKIKRIKVKNKNRGSNYIDKIILTYKCFKQLCISSQSKHITQFIKDYLEIEKIILQCIQVNNII